MATWTAKCWLGQSAGYQQLEVQANTISGAKQQLERVYGAEQIINLHEVRNNSSGGSSGGSSGSFEGSAVLIGLIAAGWAFMSFTPFILMGILGASATWVSQLITGQTIEEYTERKDDKGHGKAVIVLVLTLLAGGFGFVKGTELQKEWNNPSTPAQVQSK